MNTPRSTQRAARPRLETLIEPFTLGPFATNCYLLRAPEGRDAWIIDAGWGAEAIIDRARDLDLAPSRLILTHAHPDHIAGASAVREAFPGIRVAIHAAETDWLADPAKNLSSALGETPIVTAAPDDVLEDDQTLELAGDPWRVIHLPGHSPGGIALYSSPLAVAFVGDTLFAGSIGRYDFPSSDGPTLFASIREKLYALPEDTLVLAGHGPSTTIGREMKTNPFVRPE